MRQVNAAYCVQDPTNILIRNRIYLLACLSQFVQIRQGVNSLIQAPRKPTHHNKFVLYEDGSNFKPYTQVKSYL